MPQMHNNRTKRLGAPVRSDQTKDKGVKPGKRRSMKGIC